jgi:cytochrome d ubiquinol oxidase subunit II
MTGIACIGVPIVLAYHVFTYRTFQGRLKMDDHQ